MSSMYITTRRDLHALCDKLRSAPQVAVDTEFVGEKTYIPRLEIIQVAAPGIEAIIDFQALRELGPFAEILTDLAIEKVFHAGGQDLDIFWRLLGQVTAPIFDTQVAAAFLGYGAQPGLAVLAERLLGHHLSKSETLTDWSQRPLTPAQREYALQDVRYLLEMRTILGTALSEKGRTAWVEAELHRLTDPATFARLSAVESWQRVKGASGLRPRELAVVRELAAWREAEAQRRDRPRTTVMRDDVLIGVARKAPTTPAELQEIRGIAPRDLERHGQTLLDAIRRGLAVPRAEAPHFPQRASLGGQESALMELLQAWLRARAEEHDLVPSLLATTSELQALIESRGTDPSLPILHGWRRELAGDELVALVQGRAGLTWDSARQTLTLVYGTTKNA